jgi:hypothetical protein
MKINSTKFYTTLFVIVLFLQLYLPSFKANIFLQLFVLLFFFIFNRVTISYAFLKSSYPIFILFFMGFIGVLLYKQPLLNVFKDVFHFLKPILGLLIGYLFYKKINDFRLFLKTVIVVGFLSAIVHLLILIISGDLFTFSINVIRGFGRDNFLELFALFFLLYQKKLNLAPLFKNNLARKIIFIVLLISNILYFSRTMIVVAIILYISVKGFTKITRNGIKIIGVFFVSILLLYVYLYSVKLDRNKPGLESFLFKIKIAPSEIFTTKIDREDHKDLWDHWRGYEAKRAIYLMNENPETYFLGNGFGSLVNLKFFAPLTEDDKGIKYISELHNGYIYVLYKVGSIGLLFYLLFLINLYRKIYKSKGKIALLVSSIAVVYLFTTLTITGIYNNRDIIIMLLGGLLYFSEKDNFITEKESL